MVDTSKGRPPSLGSSTSWEPNNLMKMSNNKDNVITPDNSSSSFEGFYDASGAPCRAPAATDLSPHAPVFVPGGIGVASSEAYHSSGVDAGAGAAGIFDWVWPRAL